MTTPHELLSPIAETTEKRSYWCFISYRHSDNKEQGRQWATWLHQAIETYEVPADLVGQKNERGETIPERIFPVFRDEEELPVDADLASPIYRALDNSRYLLAICSPRAVESTYVASEIRYFKQIGRENHVLAAIIDGEPNAFWDEGKQFLGFTPAQECFPEPLRHSIDSEGKSLGKTEPIAADFRLNDGSQGWTSPEAYRQALRQSGLLDGKALSAEVENYRKKCELMKLKILAGILGVALGTLTKRDAAYQLALAQQRARSLRRWLAAVAVLMVLALAGGVVAVFQRNAATAAKEQALQQQVRAELGEKKAKKSRDQAESILSYLLFDLRDQLAPIGKLAIVENVQEKVAEYYKNLGVDPNSPDQMRNRSVALGNQGDLLVAQGKLDEALVVYQQNLNLNRKAAQSAPDNSLSTRDLMSSLQRVGEVYMAQGKLEPSLAAYHEALELCRALNQRAPAQPESYQDLGTGLENVGSIYQQLGKLEQAQTAFEESLKWRRLLTQINPSDPKWQLELASGLIKSGDAYQAQGRLDTALATFEESLKIQRGIIATDPSNTVWQRGLLLALQRVGLTFKAQAKLELALAPLEEYLQVSRRLTQSDPTNAQWQNYLGLALQSVGSVYQAQGKPDQALAVFEEFISSSRSLVQKDRSNKNWQRNLGISLQRVAEIYRDQGKIDQALVTFEEHLSITRALALSDPSSANWQRDLGVALEKIASIYRDQDKPDQALAASDEYLKLSRALALSDPSNSQWQADLGTALRSLGQLYLDQERLDSAQLSFEENLRIRTKLAEGDASNKEWQHSLGAALQDMGDLDLARGKPEAAEASFGNSLKLARPLAKADPGNLMWHKDVALATQRLGKAYLAQGKQKEALAAFDESLQKTRDLVQSDPTNKKNQISLGLALHIMAENLKNQKRSNESLDYCKEAEIMARQLTQSNPSDRDWQHMLSLSLYKLGFAYSNQKKFDQAQNSFQESLDLARELLKIDPDRTLWRQDLAASLEGLAIVYQETKNYAEGESICLEYLAFNRRISEQSPDEAKKQQRLANAQIKLEGVYQSQGNYGLCIEIYTKDLLPLLRRISERAPTDVNKLISLGASLYGLAEVCQKAGDRPKAIAALDELVSVSIRLAENDFSRFKTTVEAYFMLTDLYLADSQPEPALKRLEEGRALTNAYITKKGEEPLLMQALQAFDFKIAAIKKDQPAPKVAEAADVKVELQRLVAQIQTKLKEGERTEMDLAEELKGFDKLLAAHKGEITDDVAQVLFTKAILYLDVLGDEAKGSKLLRQVKRDFPETKAGNKVDGIMASNAKQAEARKIQKSLMLGSKFPEFAEKDLAGKPLSVANYKGKVVLVDFWASWCGPCVDELPNVLKTYEKYHAQGFEIIGISLDQDEQALNTFIKQKKMPWAQYFDGKGFQGKLAGKYGINSIPTTYLIDGGGNIIGIDLRGAALEAAVAKAMVKE